MTSEGFPDAVGGFQRREGQDLGTSPVQEQSLADVLIGPGIPVAWSRIPQGTVVPYPSENARARVSSGSSLHAQESSASDRAACSAWESWMWEGCRASCRAWDVAVGSEVGEPAGAAVGPAVGPSVGVGSGVGTGVDLASSVRVFAGTRCRRGNTGWGRWSPSAFGVGVAPVQAIMAMPVRNRSTGGGGEKGLGHWRVSHPSVRSTFHSTGCLIPSFLPSRPSFSRRPHTEQQVPEPSLARPSRDITPLKCQRACDNVGAITSKDMEGTGISWLQRLSPRVSQGETAAC